MAELNKGRQGLRTLPDGQQPDLLALGTNFGPSTNILVSSILVAWPASR
jgi:hypothetical protein